MVSPPHFHTVPHTSKTCELPVITRDDGVFRTLARRKTTRIFEAQSPMSIEELSIVLYYVWGCHGYWPVYEDIVGLKKTSPSGGDLHPTEVYPLITNVSGLDPGMYHYNVEKHRLQRLSQ